MLNLMKIKIAQKRRLKPNVSEIAINVEFRVKHNVRI